MALIESIGDPTLTVGLSFNAILVKMETGEWADVMRLSQAVIDLADGDPVKGTIVGSPLAVAYATRGMARAVQGRPASDWLADLAETVPMARETDPTTYAIVIDFTYGTGICAGAMQADDTALELIDEGYRSPNDPVTISRWPTPIGAGWR